MAPGLKPTAGLAAAVKRKLMFRPPARNAPPCSVVSRLHWRSPLMPTEFSRVLLLAAALVGGAGACTVGPRYHKPNITPPEAWKTDIGKSIDAGASGATGAAGVNATPPVWPSSEWWRGFKSAQLDDLIAQAQKANDDLAAAVARVREADAQVKIAGAPLLPSLSVGGTATRERAKPQGVTVVNGTPTQASPVTFNQFAAQATASYELDFWGRNLATRASAY